MSDDDETHPHITYGGRSLCDMDEAFCERMRWAIQAGLESAPFGVVTAPGTKKPKYLAAEPRPLVSSQRDMELA
jgi:hypothetical protein